MRLKYNKSRKIFVEFFHIKYNELNNSCLLISIYFVSTISIFLWFPITLSIKPPYPHFTTPAVSPHVSWLSEYRYRFLPLLVYAIVNQRERSYKKLQFYCFMFMLVTFCGFIMSLHSFKIYWRGLISGRCVLIYNQVSNFHSGYVLVICLIIN